MSVRSLGDYLRDLGKSWTSLWNLVSSLFSKLKDFKDHLFTLFDRIEALISNAEHEFDAIKNFQSNPKWNTRVILAPRAVTQVQEFFSEVPDRVISSVRDIVRVCKEKIEPADINPEDFKFLPEKFVKAGEKLLAWATLIIDSVTAISSIVDDLANIVDSIRQIREQLENFDVLFLPSGKPKTTVEVKYRKRI